MTGPKVWLDYDQKQLDSQYDQRVLVPDADAYMARNLVASRRVRAEMDCRLDVAYGPSGDEKLDVFPANRAGAPVVVYVHGGAWTRWDKAHNSFQAPAFVRAGAAYVAVDFALVPQVSLDEQVRQNRAAVAWVYRNAAGFGADPQRLFVAGHSSGAHVVGLLAVNDWHAAAGLPADLIKGAVAVSGMYDLEPVRLSARNAYLHLDDAAVARNSMLRQLPARMPPMIVAWGGKEQLEFQRQSRDLVAELRRRGDACEEYFYPGHNHFDMSNEFANPDSAFMQAAFRMMGLT